MSYKGESIFTKGTIVLDVSYEANIRELGNGLENLPFNSGIRIVADPRVCHELWNKEGKIAPPLKELRKEIVKISNSLGKGQAFCYEVTETDSDRNRTAIYRAIN